jgi:hypothetical protein
MNQALYAHMNNKRKMKKKSYEKKIYSTGIPSQNNKASGKNK